MKKLLGIIVLGLLLSSCATVPRLEYSYPTGGQFTSHVVMGYDDENVKMRKFDTIATLTQLLLVVFFVIASDIRYH